MEISREKTRLMTGIQSDIKVGEEKIKTVNNFRVREEGSKPEVLA
jgi:hypothetical protein